MLMSDPTPSAKFHPAAPILPVAGLAASLDYYVRVLGFTLDLQDAIGMASVSRERCTDRKSGVEGKRVDLGGRRSIKKKK